jgi:putative hydrolase of the HAD superfamily
LKRIEEGEPQPVPQPIAAVLFDAGNTLIEPHPSTAAVVARALAGDGIRVSVEQQAAMDGLVWKYYNHYQSARGLKTSPAESLEFWRLVYHDISRDLGLGDPQRSALRLLHTFQEADAWRLFPDVLPALRQLAGMGVRIGIISNWTTALHGILAGLGVTPYAEFVVTSAEAGYEKPETAIYAFALQGRGLDPSGCLYVGDSPGNDLHSSLAFGMQFALIDRDGRHADLDCRRLNDLRSLSGLLSGRIAG